jgi:hypothetical protein
VLMSEGDIDSESGVIIIPSAIESEAPPQSLTPTTPATPEGGGVTYVISGPGTSIPTPTTAAQPAQQTTVRLALRVNRQQVYTLANTLNNLADKAGSVNVMVEATKPDGFDPAWLRNAVLEPLEEADISVEEVG